MEKLSLTIDVSKIDKTKIVDRTFKTKDGQTITSKDLKLEVVPVQEPKLIKEGDTWSMWKTHFVALEQTKEERENKVKSVILGDGIMFKKKGEQKQEEPEEDISSIPF